MSAPLQELSRALDERHVLIVCGSGGVGKTTTAAALGVQAALRGRRVLVCTIDPSRRLATRSTSTASPPAVTARARSGP